MKIINIIHHSLCPRLLKPGSVVIDLGANYGAFANEMASRFHCRVHAVEASPSTFVQIADGTMVQKFNIAICGTSGPVKLNVSSNPEATSLKRLENFEYVETIIVQGQTLNDFLKSVSVSQIDLLKMDIEGAEIEVFNSCTDEFLRTIGQITVEFHEWTGVSSRVEVKNIVHRLRSLGFFVFKQTRIDYSDVLFVNRRHMSNVDYAFTKLCVWTKRAKRYASRKIIGRS